MKKLLRGIFIAFVALAVLVGGIFIYSTVDNRTLKNTIKDYDVEIFAPLGMADEYEDLARFTFDDHRIWKYKLNRKEAEQMSEELKNSYWFEFSDDVKKETEFYLTDEKWYEDLSDEVYCCLYCTYHNKFVDFSDEGLVSFLFLYDALNQEYYCVYITI